MDHGTFLGWIGDDVLHSLYRIADVCVVPSIYEPFGLVALEAMASDCPCIVADTGGLREVVPHNEAGLRFRARDPEALGEMVERLLTDAALRDRLVAEGSEHVLRFDWADVAESTAEVYAELVGERPGPERLGPAGDDPAPPREPAAGGRAAELGGRGGALVGRRPGTGVRRGQVVALRANRGLAGRRRGRAGIRQGEILRTHVMRPTWHFVAADDIRWLLRLTAPASIRRTGTGTAGRGLDAETGSRARALPTSSRAASPDAQGAGRGAGAEGIEGDSLRARLRLRPRGARAADLQRPAAGQAAHLPAARRPGSARSRTERRGGPGRAREALFPQPRPGHGPRFLLVVGADADGGPGGDLPGRAGARHRARGRGHALVLARRGRAAGSPPRPAPPDLRRVDRLLQGPARRPRPRAASRGPARPARSRSTAAPSAAGGGPWHGTR